MTGGKLLPREQIACQLTKDEGQTSLQVVQHPLFPVEEVCGSCHQTQKPNKKYVIINTWEAGSARMKEGDKEDPCLSHGAGNLAKKKRRNGICQDAKKGRTESSGLERKPSLTGHPILRLD